VIVCDWGLVVVVDAAAVGGEGPAAVETLANLDIPQFQKFVPSHFFSKPLLAR
jgi:hypothetical protein